jgi:hypothetical protein
MLMLLLPATVALAAACLTALRERTAARCISCRERVKPSGGDASFLTEAGLLPNPLPLVPQGRRQPGECWNLCCQTSTYPCPPYTRLPPRSRSRGVMLCRTRGASTWATAGYQVVMRGSRLSH